MQTAKGLSASHFLALWRSLDRAEVESRSSSRRLQIDFLRAAIVGWRVSALQAMTWESVALRMPPPSMQSLAERVLCAILNARPRAGRRGPAFPCAFPRHLWRTICVSSNVPTIGVASACQIVRGSKGARETVDQVINDFLLSRGRLTFVPFPRLD